MSLKTHVLGNKQNEYVRRKYIVQNIFIDLFGFVLFHL